MRVEIIFPDGYVYALPLRLSQRLISEARRRRWSVQRLVLTMLRSHARRCQTRRVN